MESEAARAATRETDLRHGARAASKLFLEGNMPPRDVLPAMLSRRPPFKVLFSGKQARRTSVRPPLLQTFPEFRSR